MKKPLVLATRRSPLAMRQAELVATLIVQELNREVTLLPMVTTGDRQSDWSLEKSGGKGLFTKELENALLDGRADLAVHSAKDMPTEMPLGLSLAAFLTREHPADVLIIKEGVVHPSVIASGSPRRKAQGKKLFPLAKWIELRGNVETRLQKIADGIEAEATFLAAAGLNRLQIFDFPGLKFKALDYAEMVPAPGQGAIAVQTRTDEINIFSALSDANTQRAVEMERTLLSTFGGGCQVALGVHYNHVNDTIYFFHEECGIKSMKLNGKPQADWMNEIIQWTISK